MEKIIDVCITYEEKDEKVFDYLENYVRKQIREKKDEFETEVLLSYPVVYVHCWKNDWDKWNYYVGESNDLIRRTREHVADAEASVWHKSWREARRNRREMFSFYFSGTEMNKSLVEDLEDSLISFLLVVKQSTGGQFRVWNGRWNHQYGYSNKYIRNEILEEIWKKLRSNFPNILLDYAEVLKESERYGSEYSLTDGMSVQDYIGIDVVKHICNWKKDSEKSGKKLEDQLCDSIEKEYGKCSAKTQLILEYPVVYLHLWKEKDLFHVYVGESNHLKTRTSQHKKNEDTTQKQWKDSWRKALEREEALSFVFAHGEWNKSMTLEIENRLIQYFIFLASTNSKKLKVENGRTNEQNYFDNKEKMSELLLEIIEWITKNKELKNFFGDKGIELLSITDVQKSSVFMASPLMKLTSEQEEAKKIVIDTILNSFDDVHYDHTLIVVRGSAGTGKTVLLGSMFFALLEKEVDEHYLRCHFVVNHAELYKLYKRMTKAWRLTEKDSKLKLIWKAQEYINKETKTDVLLVDESHLLYTQGYQGTIKKAQLPELLLSSKVTVLMYDADQVMEASQWQERSFADTIEELKIKTGKRIRLIDANDHPELLLDRQMRMKCDDASKQWIQALSREGDIPRWHGESCSLFNKQGTLVGYGIVDNKGYKIAVFSDPIAMMRVIEEEEKPACLLATYDWKYPSKREVKEKRAIPATIEIPVPVSGNKKDYYKFRWHWTGGKDAMSAVQWTMASAVDEVGAKHDIQGFDVRVAGVFLGPSVTYRNGKITFDLSENKRQAKNVTLEDGRVIRVGEKVMGNEIGVLLTRATEGLCIYACDKELREALLESVKPK